MTALLTPKQRIAELIGLPEEKIIIHVIGGWLKDDFNPIHLPVAEGEEVPEAHEFDPELPTLPKIFYAEISIRKSDNTIGPRFRLDLNVLD